MNISWVLRYLYPLKCQLARAFLGYPPKIGSQHNDMELIFSGKCERKCQKFLPKSEISCGPIFLRSIFVRKRQRKLQNLKHEHFPGFVSTGVTFPIIVKIHNRAFILSDIGNNLILFRDYWIKKRTFHLVVDMLAFSGEKIARNGASKGRLVGKCFTAEYFQTKKKQPEGATNF